MAISREQLNDMVAKAMESIPDLQEGQTYGIVRNKMLMGTTKLKSEVARESITRPDCKWVIVLGRSEG